jgi:microcin C transport system substrate-binding protein
MGPIGGLLLALLLILGGPGPAASQTAGPKVTAGHALSMYGDLKYPAGFTHFHYVSPDAPMGGDV